QSLGEYAAGKAGADDQVVEAATGAGGVAAAVAAAGIAFRVAVAWAHIAHVIFSFICFQVWSQDMSPRMLSALARRVSGCAASSSAASLAATNSAASAAIRTRPLSP